MSHPTSRHHCFWGQWLWGIRWSWATAWRVSGKSPWPGSLMSWIRHLAVPPTPEGPWARLFPLLGLSFLFCKTEGSDKVSFLTCRVHEKTWG